MSDTNRQKLLEPFGSHAVWLDQQVNKIDDESLNDEESEALIIELAEYIQSNNLRSLIEKLGKDAHAANRELAAASLLYLLQRWKFLPYNASDPDASTKYHAAIMEYAQGLTWTVPVLEGLLQDKDSDPLQTAVNVLAEIEYDEFGDAFCKPLRPYCIAAVSNSSKEVRLLAVSNLATLYPTDDEARSILEENALEALLGAVSDKDETVRDWACFELHSGVSNLPERAGALFEERMATESPDSEVYIEAVTGLARLGYTGNVTEVICQRLQQDDFGTGWIDAAAASTDKKCKEALAEARKRLAHIDPEDEYLSLIDDALVED